MSKEQMKLHLEVVESKLHEADEERSIEPQVVGKLIIAIAAMKEVVEALVEKE